MFVNKPGVLALIVTVTAFFVGGCHKQPKPAPAEQDVDDAIPETVNFYSQKENLLLNNGADDGNNLEIAGWQSDVVEAEGLLLYRETRNMRSGRACFAITNTHTYDKETSNSWLQEIKDVPIGRVVRLGTYIRTESVNRASASIRCLDQDGNILACASAPVVDFEQKDWLLLYSQAVVVPLETTRLHVLLTLTGRGKAWFDDVTAAIYDPKVKLFMDSELAEAVSGKIVRVLPIVKDCSILAYQPHSRHGNVDVLSLADNYGGVRCLVAWSQIDHEDIQNPAYSFIVALYSRETVFRPPVSAVGGYEILKNWPQITSWSTQPAVAQQPFARFEFVPENGWRLFDISALVRDQYKNPRKSYGAMFIFDVEDREIWSGYRFVSTEAFEQYRTRHPKLLVVQTSR